MSESAAVTRIERFVDRLGSIETPFCIELPNGSRRHVGQGEPQFELILRNDRGVRAIGSLDEGNIAEAYLRGDLDLEGDMIRPFATRASLDDRHPIVAAWRFLQPLMFGQVYANKAAIASHYDADPKLFLCFLDREFPAYSQGIYENDEETLAAATRRKFEYCMEKCELDETKRVLEIGPGWGAFADHALKSGVGFTGITNSEVSRSFLASKFRAHGDRFGIVLDDIFDYQTDEPYDAIVIMGVIEHLPNYARVLKKFASLLKPGGRVFLDASAARKKYELSTFMVRYIYPANHSFLVLHDFLDKMKSTPFELLEVHNDRYSYFLTFRQWAMNLESSQEFIRREFGDFEYRKFRLYLWGAAYEFLSRNLECYRMVFHLPKNSA